MGEVWKAEDTQLRRTVALKFLSSETVDDDEVKTRLIREAQAAASLDHPNICPVYGIHEENGETFIAMAYVDGPSLADKIKERPLPLDEALNMAIQIAEGLQEAHEKRIVHRDIKPQNIMLTAKGQVKIMDFGLAAVAGRSRLTKSGTTLGTPAYMSPEQLEGRDVDRRADIWALGVVLYEMLTQRTPFAADYEQAIAYGILNEEPEPVTAQRRGVPPKVDDLLTKALAKDASERYQHVEEMIVDLKSLSKKPQKEESKRYGSAGELEVDLGNLADQLKSGRTTVIRSAMRPSLAAEKKSIAAWLIGAAALVAGLVIGGLAFRSAPPPAPEVRFEILPPEGVLGVSVFEGEPVVSPDGRKFAFLGANAGGESALYLRSLDRVETAIVAGTQGAAFPFWSPDSRYLAFFTDDKLFRVDVNGGAPQALCDVVDGRGGAWADLEGSGSGVIVYSQLV